jgi:uncharacterized membrane protein
MITLIILLAVFIIAILLQKLLLKTIDFSFAGRIAMSAMLVFTGIGHFLYSHGMSLMLPPSVPFRKELVLITGFIEILAAVTLLFTRWQRITSILLIIFFIGVLPANIYASLNHVNYQTGAYDGKGPDYLWMRIPLQLLFIAWVWYFGLKKDSSKRIYREVSVAENP